MFFFGLFSTHLPYIILASLYLLGIGAYSANAIRDRFQKNIPDEKILFVDSKQPVKFTQKDFHYNQYKTSEVKKDVSEKNESIQNTIFKVFNNRKICIELNCFYVSSLNFSLFSRPPPSLS